MKNVDCIAAQGDVLFLRVDELPEGLQRDPTSAPIVAHSESGHHHVVRARAGFEVERYVQDAQTSFLRIRRIRDQLHEQADQARTAIDEALAAVATHEKSGPDAHAQLGLLCPGEEAIYQVNRQVELRPDGWTMVAD